MSESSKKPGKLFISTRDESPQFFNNPFLDFFSRVPFWVPPTIFLPAIFFFTWLSFHQGVPLLAQLTLFPAGVLAWSLVEYLVHRFVFHFEPMGRLLSRLQYIFHGIHHDYPQDRLRLVLPPIMSVPLGIGFCLSFRAAFGMAGVVEWSSSFIAGFGTAYLLYDMLHFASHHLNWKNPCFEAIKRHHMQHHLKNPGRGFGFTSELWDRVFRTNFESASDRDGEVPFRKH